MLKLNLFITGGIMFLMVFAFSCSTESGPVTSGPGNYEDLVSLFKEFRQFDRPSRTRGVPDYTPEKMAEKYSGLKEFQSRLKAIDLSGWPVSEQVDYHLVRAEMNGMEFNHRVLHPWSRDPNFYLERLPWPREDDLWFPMDEIDLPQLENRLGRVPKFLAQAKENMKDLSGVSGDLAAFAIRNMEQRKPFRELSGRILKHHPEMDYVIEEIQAALDDYLAWMKENQSRMTAPVGVGKENYNWLLKNVYLFPYTWEDCLRIVELEDNRVITFRELEENRNRNLPPLVPVSSQKEYRDSYMGAIEHVMNFLEEEEIFTVHDYLVPDEYLEDRGSGMGKYSLDSPWPEHHDYFFNFSLREPLMEETHEMVGHHFDLLTVRRDDRPIRGDREHEGPYYVACARLEGFAFALEELMMHAGYLDGRNPHGREIVYDQAAFRTVRAMSDLKMHKQDWSLEDAMEYCVANAPQGHLLDGSPHLWNEMHSTLTMVGWHMQMVVGKVHFMKLFRDRAQQLGDEFVLKDFMDEYFAAGVIPTSLIRWEMTGYEDEIKKLW